ncbi:MAG: hypothetical protein IPL41_09310 [Micropruina sp.]|nr:hypothetical protein [Micropruina sp.]
MRPTDDWPRDPRLDPFRDAVWQLSKAGVVQAYLITQVVPMRSMPVFWAQQEWLWYRICWLDGRRDPPRHDQAPGWPVVEALEQARFELDDIASTVLAATPVRASERDVLWQRYRP